MAVDLKSATPDTTIPSDGFLFGADSQSASAPSVYPLSAIWQKLCGSPAVSDAANTLGLRNGTSAQRINLASSWTDASNLSRAFIDAGQTIANTLFFGSEHLGTGGNALTKFQLNLDGVTKLNYDVTLPGGWYTPTAFMAGGLVIGAGFYGLPAASVALSTNDGSSSLTLATGSATFNQPASAPTLRTSTAYTVATLPNAATVGAGTRAFVTDATQTLTAGIGAVVAGGGANKAPVISDGANWLIG